MTKVLERKGGILLLEGIDISKPAEYISDNSSPNTQNFYVDRGVLTKRTGTTEVGSTQSEEILGGREFIRSGVNYVVRFGLTESRKYNSGTNAWDDISGTAWTGTTDDIYDTAVPLLSGNTILCATNGIDNIRKYTGTGNFADLGGSPPVAKYIQEYKTYLVAANIQGGTDIAQRVQWCDTAAPETWTGGNSGSVDLVDDDKPITGMGVYGGFLSVHKESAIYLGRLVSSSAVFQFDRINTEVGAIANTTIRTLPTGEQIFLGPDGLRLFNGVLAPLIESPINEEIRDGLARKYAHKSWSVLDLSADEVWIGIPIGAQTTGDTVYKFNYKTRVLYKDTRSNITAAWRWTATSNLTWDDLTESWDDLTFRWDDAQLLDEAGLIMLADNTGSTYKVDSTTNNDAGTAIDAVWESKDFQLDQQQMARWLELEVWAKGSSFKIEYSTDRGFTWKVFSGSPYTLGNEFPTYDSPIIFYFDEVSSLMRIRFTNNTAGETVAIQQFILSCRPWGTRNG